jgi:CheY-like chemotaxis protein
MPERLLVVDDDDVNREIIAEYLDDAGYLLVVADCGEAALRLMHEGASFDAVILDRMMPGLDGMEVLRRMKSAPRLRDVPVIMQTAAASHEQIAEGLKLGAYYYLTKPFHRDALRAVVRAALALVLERRNLARRIGDYQGVIQLMDECICRLRTLEEARGLAVALGTLCVYGDAAGLGLLELMVNAVEHGNLGISFDEKSALMSAGRWEQEVANRLVQPEHRDKMVEVRVKRENGCLYVRVRDQGKGFDWRPFLTMDESRAFYPNGRGIAVASQIAFTSLQYLGCGNEVAVVLPARERPGVAAPAPAEQG